MSQQDCDACRKRGQTWRGDAPRCSFPAGGAFVADGWNCATADLIRDLCHEVNLHPLVDYRYIDDQKYATICVDGVGIPSGEAYALWVTWYKNRGATDAMWLLNEGEPRRPTEKDCVAIATALTAIRSRK